MKRKVVKQGTATMMVSLPAGWVKQNKVEKGAEINLEQLGKKLVITSGDFKETKLETSLKLTRLEETSIRTILVNTYRKGYDHIIIHYNTEKQFEIINHLVKTHLIGFEIVKKSSSSCIIENVTEPLAVQFDSMIKKIFHNIVELIRVTEERLEGKNSDYYIEIQERIQRYDNFCRRIIAKRKTTIENPEYVWAFLVQLNHAQREIYHLNKFLNSKMKISPDIKKLMKYFEKLFILVKETYFNEEIKTLEEIHRTYQEVNSKKGSSFKGKNAYQCVILNCLYTGLRQLYQVGSPLSGLIM